MMMVIIITALPITTSFADVQSFSIIFAEKEDLKWQFVKK